MKNTTLRFFAQYYLYIMVLVVTIYFLVVIDSPLPLFLIGFFSFSSVIFSKFLKKIIAKRRNTKEQLFSTSNRYAFPSSHAAGLSSLLFSTFGDPIWYCILVSTVIILLSRVQAKVHDYKDILGGFLVGGIVTAGLTLLRIVVVTL